MGRPRKVLDILASSSIGVPWLGWKIGVADGHWEGGVEEELGPGGRAARAVWWMYQLVAASGEAKVAPESPWGGLGALVGTARWVQVEI